MNNYRLYYKKLSRWHDPEQVFPALYADKKYTFWLDNKDFSYMGIASKRIKYSISNHALSISDNNKTQKLRQNIFTYLQKELLSWKGVASVGAPSMREVPLGEIPVERPQPPLRRSQSPWGGSEDVGLGKRETGPLFNFTGGFVGYFGYEMKAECDCLSLRGGQSRRSNPVKNCKTQRDCHAHPLSGFARNDKKKPDAYLFFVDKFLAFDHQQKCLYLVALSENKKEADQWFSATTIKLSNLTSNFSTFDFRLSTFDSPLTFTPSQSRQQYIKNIRTCQKYLIQGDAYQICLTNQITANIKTDWLALYRTLRAANPAPFNAYINFGNFALLSSSPEQFLQVDKEGWVTGKPMKGTVRRGDTRKKDLRLAGRLGKTEKDYAENIMIVDLVRNDLGKICEFGSIKVTKPLEVQTYATVHQLVSTIKGKLRPETNIIDLLQAAFPGGSMTGTPKIAACGIIAELEKTPRGIYSGTFGFLSLNGTANLAMTIRTIIADKEKLSFGAGGAILTDSVPQEEYEEMLLKAQPLITSIVKTTGAKTFHLNF